MTQTLRKNSSRKSKGDDNMIPMINIVFLLLIFFMVAGQVSTLKAPGIELPANDGGDKPDKAPLKLVLTKDNQINLSGVSLTLEELDAALSEAARADSKDDTIDASIAETAKLETARGEASIIETSTENTRINLLADRDVVASELEPLLDLLRQHKILSVNLLTKQQAGSTTR